ncbi:MAG: aspartate kinase [Kiritimatiellia bacterium]
MKVCKFGGSCLADAERLRHACNIVMSDPERRLVVVSAPGERYPDDTKVTDLLIAAAERVLEGRRPEKEMDEITGRFAAIQEALGLPDSIVKQIRDDLNDRLSADTSHRERYLDGVKARGEDYCARLVTEQLRAMGADGKYMDPCTAGLRLSDEYGNARLLPESYENLSRWRDSSGITVFPGFYGCTPQGEVVTFPRGGSDITGSILAAAVNAELYENFTDVDSVFAADPAIVPEAGPIEELTYREMRELSYAGFGVLHDEAIVPAVRAGVPICVKNVKHPDSAGTTILPEHLGKYSRVAGIAAASGFCTVFSSKYLMNREIGFGRHLLQIFEEEGLSYEHAPSGIDSMSVLLCERGFDGETERTVRERIEKELGADAVEVERGLALIMIVGEGMRHTVGLAAKAAGAMAKAGVNIEMMNQGSSEISMMFGVRAADREKAVRSLYEAFFS